MDDKKNRVKEITEQVAEMLTSNNPRFEQAAETLNAALYSEFRRCVKDRHLKVVHGGQDRAKAR